jgi:PPIC-type PPIASE domain
MTRLLTSALVVIALAAGALSGEFLSEKPETHRIAGWIFRRGDLVAMFHHRGIFERERIADEVLQVSSGHGRADKGELERAMVALRGQFDGDRNFAAALRRNGAGRWQLREMMAGTLRGEAWIEQKLALPGPVDQDKARNYFQGHQAEFAQPLRIRPWHIFLAAPQGSDVIEAKRATMEELMRRLQSGEDFASLAAAVSEDEATKSRGGDLGFLASNRVPEEFWEAIENLPVNGPVTLVQSHLGFHAVQILEKRPARAMTFEEARPEIEQRLDGEKRRAAVARLQAQLERAAVLVGR